MYTADQLKKEYEKDFKAQRIKNLVRLREDIAKLSQTDFSKVIGIQKSNLSFLENGERDLSLFNIQAYKKYFLESHNINLSSDYLLGYTTAFENNTSDLCDELGLSEGALWILKNIKNKQLSDDFEKLPYAVDFLLRYEITNGHTNNFSILRNIYDFLFGNFTTCGTDNISVELIDETRTYKREVSLLELNTFILSALTTALTMAKFYVEGKPNEFQYYGKNISEDEKLLIDEISKIEYDLGLLQTRGGNKTFSEEEQKQMVLEFKRLEKELYKLRKKKGVD